LTRLALIATPFESRHTTVTVLEALRDVCVDRNIIRPPKWIGTQAATMISGWLAVWTTI